MFNSLSLGPSLTTCPPPRLPRPLPLWPSPSCVTLGFVFLFLRNPFPRTPSRAAPASAGRRSVLCLWACFPVVCSLFPSPDATRERNHTALVSLRLAYFAQRGVPAPMRAAAEGRGLGIFRSPVGPHRVNGPQRVCLPSSGASRLRLPQEHLASSALALGFLSVRSQERDRRVGRQSMFRVVGCPHTAVRWGSPLSAPSPAALAVCWFVGGGRSGGRRRHLIVALVGISLVSSDIERLFLRLLAGCLHVLFGDVFILVLCPRFNWIFFVWSCVSSF